ncbi:hypothetical protein Taro_043305 [Colocasia esculenta]|uniref:BHLH domain-containing protein n=1 Tax=Colocasia esculenta TaxID=4460 RepID=A0A843WVD1_COLES|nr:hypothetical protein [Colocasia esculenta]
MRPPMEPQIAQLGGSEMYGGVSEDRRLHFGLYGSFAAPCEYGTAATMARGIPGFVSSFYGPLELAGMAEEEEPMDRVMAASRNHREAERRRRERIKYHLDRLRDILSCDAKTDKASLLAKAVDHVRGLKQRAAEIGEMTENFPTEMDEVSVHPGDLPASAGQGPVIRASLCCEDRSGLLPELAETLRSLRLRILRAEIATLGSRVRNVLVVAGDDGGGEGEEESGSCSGGVGQVAFLKDALSALVDRAVPGGAARQKRRRVSERSAATA